MRTVLTVGVVAAALVLMPASADACTCQPAPVGVLFPLDGARVPRNVHFWVRAFDSGLVIVTPEGEEIALEKSEVDLAIVRDAYGGISVFAPREPLAVGEGYTLRARTGGLTEVRFSVDDELDTTPPEKPVVAAVDAIVNEDEGNSCGIYRGLAIWLEAEGIVFAVQEADELSDAPPSGRALDFAQPAPRGSSFLFGTSCGPAWPGEDDTLTLRFASFDAAGNISAFSEAEPFRRPKPTEEGCSAAPSARHALGNAVPLVLGIGLLAGVRASRRISHRASQRL